MKARLVDTSRPEIDSALIWLQQQIFPADETLDPAKGWWWLVSDDESPVAFAAMTGVPSWPGSAYMARCGVLRKYRGQGLQRRLLTIRERKARELGLQRVITTTYNNPPSANNLIARGFITYEPQRRWGASDTIYWMKALK